MEIKQIIQLLQQQNQQNGVQKIEGTTNQLKYKAYLLGNNKKIRIDLEINQTTNEEQ